MLFLKSVDFLGDFLTCNFFPTHEIQIEKRHLEHQVQLSTFIWCLQEKILIKTTPAFYCNSSEEKKGKWLYMKALSDIGQRPFVIRLSSLEDSKWHTFGLIKKKPAQPSSRLHTAANCERSEPGIFKTILDFIPAVRKCYQNVS